MERVKKRMVVLLVLVTFSNFFVLNAQEKLPITGYYYDPATGNILPKYGNLSPKEVEEYLKKGKVEEKYTVIKKGNWTYYKNSKGQIVKRVGKIFRNGEFFICEYKYSYYSNGKVASYTFTLKDALGHLLSIYKPIFDEEGKRISYIYTKYDSETGKKKYEYYVKFNQENKVTWRLLTYYDENGNKKSSYEYSYTYHDNGKLASYTRIQRDAQGRLVSEYKPLYNEQGKRTSYTYTRYDPDTGKKRYDSYAKYDNNGKAISATTTYYDENGNVKSIYEWTDYKYDSNGKLIQFTRYRKDANGNITQTCIWKKDSGWNCF